MLGKALTFLRQIWNAKLACWNSSTISLRRLVLVWAKGLQNSFTSKDMITMFIGGNSSQKTV